MNLIKKDRYFINKERVLMWHFSNDVLIATKGPDNKWDVPSMEWTIDEMKDCGRSECDSQGNLLESKDGGGWRYFILVGLLNTVHRANEFKVEYSDKGASWRKCSLSTTITTCINFGTEITEAEAIQRLGLAESPKPEAQESE